MMNTKIKHLAILSDDCPRMARFYETVFGMKSYKSGPEPEGRSLQVKPKAYAVSDGYLGLNFNPRKPGRAASLDHFGFEVDDVETICSRLSSDYPMVNVLQRPSNRPFAGLSTHDPEGNIFDLSQKKMSNRRNVYVSEGWKADRTIEHFVLRVMDPSNIARFYKDVFELEEEEKALEDPNFYLSDGRITLVVSPWNIKNFKGSGIGKTGLDHIGFKIESLKSFKGDLEKLKENSPEFADRPVGVGPEGEARLALLSTCRYGKSQLSDPDCVFIDVHE